MARILPRRDRYSLRDIHQEIDLYDRKLAYLDKFGEFTSSTDREEAKSRLVAKRAPLEKAARELVASGVEYKEEDLPRSFRTVDLEHSHARKNLSLIKTA